MYGAATLDLKDLPAGAPVLLNLSGGIDSTYQAWRLLRRGHQLLIHHCHYKTRQRRWPHEARSTWAVLNWFREHDLNNFDYVETSFNHGTGVIHPFTDITFLNPLTGLVLLGRDSIKHAVLGNHADSPDPHRPEAKLWQRTGQQMARRRFTWVMPTLHMSKADIIRDTPPDLFDLTWWCRSPVAGKPCRDSCGTCGQVYAVIG